jgi:hypothetical protein
LAINTYNESDLHAALKQHYAKPGDEFEGKLDGYVIDVIQRHPRTGRVTQLIEVQTSGFHHARDKRRALAARYPLRVIHPIARERTIVTYSTDGEVIGSRKSPYKGRIENIFDELVSAPDLLTLPNFTLEVAVVVEHELRIKTPTRRKRWLREYKKVGRRLISIEDWLVFECAEDLIPMLQQPPVPFDSAALAAHMRCNRRISQRAIYCLRALGLLLPAGRKGRANCYTLA